MKNGFTKIAASLMAIIILITCVAGCSKTETTPAANTVTDLQGRTVTFNAPVKNIVVLYGPGYEKLVMLGAESLITACGDFHKTHCAWAHVVYKYLDTVPAIANPSNPNVETLLGYKPDVVFYFGNDANTKAMENAGIKVICSTSSNTSIEMVKTMLMVYAQVLGGDAIKKAQDYATYFDKKEKVITDITAAIANTEKPKVYVTSGLPLRTRGGNSMVRDTVEKAGGIYIASTAQQGTNMINYEQMLAWNPDIIIVDHAPDLPDPSASATSNTPGAFAIYNQIMNDPQLQTVNAVKNHRVYVSPTGAFFWDAGQQFILLLEWMAKIFQPDKFKSLDMQIELKDFYSKFFNYKLTDEQAKGILAHELPPGAEKWGYK
jgi:iron complex transport system substrate-binding protein